MNKLIIPSEWWKYGLAEEYSPGVYELINDWETTRSLYIDLVDHSDDIVINYMLIGRIPKGSK